MKKKKFYIYFIVIICILFFAACSGQLIQKAYITNPPNVSLFDSANNLNIKFAGNFRYIENQASYSFNEHWGLASDLLFGFHSQYGADIGFVYYNRIKNKHYFEISSGYGYFNARSHMKDDRFCLGGLFSDPGGKYYRHDINSIYHKLFIQPSYFLKLKKFDLGLTIRTSLPYFTYYNCSYSIYPYCGEYNFPPWEFAKAKFKNKLGLTLEPMISFRYKRKYTSWYLQLGMCFSKNIIHSIDSIHIGDVYNYGVNSTYPYYKNNQPLCARYFINYGMEFNIRTRRRK